MRPTLFFHCTLSKKERREDIDWYRRRHSKVRRRKPAIYPGTSYDSSTEVLFQVFFTMFNFSLRPERSCRTNQSTSTHLKCISSPWQLWKTYFWADFRLVLVRERQINKQIFRFMQIMQNDSSRVGFYISCTYFLAEHEPAQAFYSQLQW